MSDELIRLFERFAEGTVPGVRYPFGAFVRHPKCDRATALLVYWLSEPFEHAEHRAPSSAPAADRKLVTLLREIEAKMAAGEYASARIPFDVHDEVEGNLAEDPRIPKCMREPVIVASGERIVAPRPPSSTSKAKTKKVKA